MLSKNVGLPDRALRIVLGLALLVAFFIDTDASWRWAYLIGIVPLATGVLGTCGLYTLLGVNTCAMRK
jgi:hypothetical protein